jgi:hypothetical protein
MYQNRFVPGSECSLQDHLCENKKVQAASNGSLDQDAALASHGWLLIGNGYVLDQGARPVDGIPDFISSTQAELFGIVQSWSFCAIFAISMASNPPVVSLNAVTIELQSLVSTTLCKNMHVDIKLLMTLILSLTSRIGSRHPLYVTG